MISNSTLRGVIPTNQNGALHAERPDAPSVEAAAAGSVAVAVAAAGSVAVAVEDLAEEAWPGRCTR